MCPAVSINNIFGDGGEVPCISCDYFRAGFLAGKYLLEKGHRKVAYLTEDLEHPETSFDFSGFKSAMETAGITLTSGNILETRKNLDIFTQNVRKFFAGANYTACFVRSTTFATMLVGVLKKLKIRVPEDMSLIAAGNYQNGRQCLVKLTTIDSRLEEMCALGLKILNAKLNQEKLPVTGITLLEPQLLEHGSVMELGG